MHELPTATRLPGICRDPGPGRRRDGPGQRADPPPAWLGRAADQPDLRAHRRRGRQAPAADADGLAARALGYQRQPRHHQLAAIIEFIHTSTLLHDDVVDESDLRRGRKTANALWGNAPSVLVGDFLYSRSFQLMVELDSHAGHAGARRRHQPDRRGRSAAAAARAQPRYRRGRLPARDRAQDRGAVRGRHAPGRACSPAPMRHAAAEPGTITA